jgi:hypothetical protein
VGSLKTGLGEAVYRLEDGWKSVHGQASSGWQTTIARTLPSAQSCSLGQTTRHRRVQVGREKDMQLTWLPTAVERGAGVVNWSENTRFSTKRLGKERLGRRCAYAWDDAA